MNDFDRLDCYLDKRPRDCWDDTRLLVVHPLSASTLTLVAPLEWLAPGERWCEPQMPLADSSARY